MRITVERLLACQDDAQRAQVLAAATPEQRHELMGELAYRNMVAECAAATVAEDAAHAAFARQIEDAPDDAARQRIIVACDPEFMAEWLWQQRAGAEDWWAKYVGTLEGAPANYRPPIRYGPRTAAFPRAALPQAVVAVPPTPIAAPPPQVTASEVPLAPPSTVPGGTVAADTARMPTQDEVEEQWRRDGDLRMGRYIPPDVTFHGRLAPALTPEQRLSPEEFRRMFGSDE